MFSKESVPLLQTGALNRLVSNYLSGRPELRPYYSYSPDISGFAEALEKPLYTDLDRQTLSEALARQAATVSNSSRQTLDNIAKLQHSQSYTITTGHQLCLFTGPLYFIYKIQSALSLAEELGRSFPGKLFIPVYWMASEDHDFEEVNHFFVNGQKISWQSDQQGAVGEFRTEGLKNVLESLRLHLGISAKAKELTELFKRAYLDHATLAEATRFLVNELFGSSGLVIADGNEASLKKSFAGFFRKDIVEHAMQPLVDESSQALAALGYHIQVHSRACNTFLMRPGLRTRLEKENGTYTATGSDLQFTAAEMEDIIEREPQQLSPNVVLRPLYQQFILPNLAYIGGPGELAYWLQFKRMHDAQGVFFPLLVPRCFYTLLNRPIQKLMQKLPFHAADYFRPAEELIRELQVKTSNFFELGEEEQRLKEVFDAVLKKTQVVDRSLDALVAAELQRSLNSVERLAGKVNRQLRRRMEEEISRLLRVREAMMPGGSPQERTENFSGFFLEAGHGLFEAIRESAHPLKKEHGLLKMGH